MDRDLTLMKFKAGWYSIRSLALWEKLWEKRVILIPWIPHVIWNAYQELFHSQRMEEWREAEQQLLRDIGYIDKSDAVDRTPYLKKEEERLKALQEDLQATADEVSHKEL